MDLQLPWKSQHLRWGTGTHGSQGLGSHSSQAKLQTTGSERGSVSKTKMSNDEHPTSTVASIDRCMYIHSCHRERREGESELDDNPFVMAFKLSFMLKRDFPLGLNLVP